VGAAITSESLAFLISSWRRLSISSALTAEETERVTMASADIGAKT
jgi:hypothetical protein